MSEDKKEGLFNGKWAVVTVHPWLPSRSEQIARARAWGVMESWIGPDDVSALIVDDVSEVKRTTNWMGKLVERAHFLDAMQSLKYAGDHVFFANPLCVGFSAKLAEQTVRRIWEAKMLVYVHSVKDNGPALYQEGDDLSEFLENVSAMANAAHQRGWRKRKSE